jgi:hypothetical protein
LAVPICRKPDGDGAMRVRTTLIGDVAPNT